ncbi:hypothetical protein HMPREF9447_04734 [Bacteroides oleiciplenus YIT 12058]|uniref:Uncharacterized protein n=2 Tax=Bacteroides oleiciplenus TaxID=626931 RepID=K9DU66_9BACE|nr:hypothetical protein HMPREF9447_04734 [Bacteroides oleiciplenus YIT 12058]
MTAGFFCYLCRNLMRKYYIIMKYVRILFAVALVFMVCSAFSFKKGKGDKEKAVYAFGVAASFNDTVVYFTDIQALDSVKLDKNGFLPKRDLYTYQLKNYLEYDLRCLDYTCMIYFSENKKKLEKEAAKVKSKYKKNKTIVLMPVASEAFRFKKPEE